ncbi:hypothetical protein [Xylanimonas sp. McL0601]|uniref:hypothetical protein n=1 Tax=Xylanimonas sp. McL0601 TaxID=3414739 RepID=UPI003CF9E12A
MSQEHGHSTTEKIADAADKVAGSVKKAVEDGIEAVRPTWEEKVAPHVVSGAAKAAGWGDSTREHADQKAAELNAEDRPSSKILGFVLGMGAAAVALAAVVARWVGKEAEKSSHPADHPSDKAEQPDEPADQTV